MRSYGNKPTGVQNVVELAVEFFDSFVRDSAGPKFEGLGNWFFMVFAFLLVSNLSGLTGIRPPTADFVTTFTFAFVTFMLINVMGLIHRKGKYLKGFFEPVAFFFPLNIIGELARPVSLSFRLFGNVLAGTILMSIVYAMVPIFLRFGFPAVLHAYFDLFSGVLQTYIFSILSLTFIGAAAADKEGA